MNKNTKRYGAWVISCSIFLTLNISLAQTPEPKEPPGDAVNSQAEMTEFSYGTVKSVSTNQIVITEYDYDKDEEIDISYTVDQNTEFEGVKSIQDIVIGNNVDIVYSVVDDKRIAQSITVEKSSSGNEAGPEDQETEPMQVYE